MGVSRQFLQGWNKEFVGSLLQAGKEPPPLGHLSSLFLVKLPEVTSKNSEGRDTQPVTL